MMRTLAILSAFSLTLGVIGCESQPWSMQQQSDAVSAGDDEREIQEALAKLNPDDRKLAEQQRWCAVQTTDRLGSMGIPTRVDVHGQPVFLCCKGCQKRALADPQKTLATVKELRSRSSGS